MTAEMKEHGGRRNANGKRLAMRWDYNKLFREHRSEEQELQDCGRRTKPPYIFAKTCCPRQLYTGLRRRSESARPHSAATSQTSSGHYRRMSSVERLRCPESLNLARGGHGTCRHGRGAEVSCFVVMSSRRSARSCGSSSSRCTV